MPIASTVLAFRCIPSNHQQSFKSNKNSRIKHNQCLLFWQQFSDDELSEISASIAYQKLSHCESMSLSNRGPVSRRVLSGQKHQAPKAESSFVNVKRRTKGENPPISESSRPYRVCTDNNPNNQRQILASNLKDLIKKGNIFIRLRDYS